MPDESSPKSISELRVRDPLSDVTRKERRALLGVSLVGIVIAKTGLLPTEISALGIKFGVSDQKAIIYVLVAVIIYFSVAFLLYATSDLLSWRIALKRTIRDQFLREANLSEDERRTRDEAMQRYGGWSGYHLPHRLTSPVSVLRAIFEFIVPLLFAAYATAVLLHANPSNRQPNLAFHTDKFQGPARLNCARAPVRRPLKPAGEFGR